MLESPSDVQATTAGLRDRSKLEERLADLNAEIEELDHLIFDAGTPYCNAREPLKRAINIELQRMRELAIARYNTLRLLP